MESAEYNMSILADKISDVDTKQNFARMQEKMETVERTLDKVVQFRDESMKSNAKNEQLIGILIGKIDDFMEKLDTTSEGHTKLNKQFSLLNQRLKTIEDNDDTKDGKSWDVRLIGYSIAGAFILHLFTLMA